MPKKASEVAINIGIIKTCIGCNSNFVGQTSRNIKWKMGAHREKGSPLGKHAGKCCGNSHIFGWRIIDQCKFRDQFCIRYKIEANNTPIKSPCGEKFTRSHALHPNMPIIWDCAKIFTLSHAFDCAKSGYTHMRHNRIRDTFAKMMHDVCYDVDFELTLQLLQADFFNFKTTSTDENAWLDYIANDLGGPKLEVISSTWRSLNNLSSHARKTP